MSVKGGVMDVKIGDEVITVSFQSTFNCNLLGLTIDEILWDGYNGRLPQLSYHDWKYIAEKVEEGRVVEETIEGYSAEFLDDEVEESYQMGYSERNHYIEYLQNLLKTNNIEFDLGE